MGTNGNDISGEIRRMIFDKLEAFNRGRETDKGRYYLRLPSGKTLYYTLWFYNPSATYHPVVYLADLDLNAISSVNKAMKWLGNSFLPLYITADIQETANNGDDLISFGKYRGYHLHDIYAIDPRYVGWIADKYEPRMRSEFRFKELAATYGKVHLDLQTPKKYKAPVSRFIGTPGETLTNLRLKITRVRIEDDPYKTQVVRGTEYFYVNQLLTAVDTAGNLFLLRIRSHQPSLASQTLPAGTHAYHTGEVLTILSAKVLRHMESRHTRYTWLGYVKIP